MTQKKELVFERHALSLIYLATFKTYLEKSNNFIVHDCADTVVVTRSEVASRMKQDKHER